VKDSDSWFYSLLYSVLSIWIYHSVNMNTICWWHVVRVPSCSIDQVHWSTWLGDIMLTNITFGCFKFSRFVLISGSVTFVAVLVSSNIQVDFEFVEQLLEFRKILKISITLGILEATTVDWVVRVHYNPWNFISILLGLLKLLSHSF
jgi:hypothetical protein